MRWGKRIQVRGGSLRLRQEVMRKRVPHDGRRHFLGSPKGVGRSAVRGDTSLSLEFLLTSVER